MISRRTIVITGGTRGLGKVLVQTFLKEKWRVAILARHRPSDFSARGNGLFLKADVTQARELDVAAAQITHEWGRIDVWINNAGGGKKAPFIGRHEQEWSEIFNVNFWGAINGCRTAIRGMLGDKKGGVIINIASLAGIYACPHHSAYSTAKAAVIALTRSLAVEYADRNIRINAIAPGPLDTEGFRAVGGNPQKRAQSIPTRKMVSPREIGEACLFLAKPLVSLTGHILTIDGGSAAIGCYAAVGKQ